MHHRQTPYDHDQQAAIKELHLVQFVGKTSRSDITWLVRFSSEQYARFIAYCRKSAATPNAANPNTATPNTANPNTANPNAATPNATNPNATTPNTSTPNTATPNAATPNTETPYTATPRLQALP